MSITFSPKNPSGSDKRKLLAKWCDSLPRFEALRSLEIKISAPQTLFDAACQLKNLERLWVKMTGAASIEEVKNLQHLKSLHLLDTPKLESIAPLSSLTNLRVLGLLNFKKIADIAPLGCLSGLEELLLGGGMYSTQRIKSVTPIGQLANIKSLTFVSLRADDETLQPLFGLSNLEMFNVGTVWNSNEIAEIKRRNPLLAAG